MKTFDEYIKLMLADEPYSFWFTETFLGLTVDFKETYALYKDEQKNVSMALSYIFLMLILITYLIIIPLMVFHYKRELIRNRPVTLFHRKHIEKYIVISQIAGKSYG